MSTLTYPYTLTDASWFDATPVMANFLAVKNLINGNLDANNFNSSMTPTVAMATCSDYLAAELITPAANLDIYFADDKAVVFRLQATPTTEYLRIEEGAVTI